ncbi:MAG: hypothetical protein ABRQ38_15000 [Candidatus Eremiobacterota bacterium]
MKIISLEDITEDMVIAQDIYSSSSQRLVAKGTVVSDSLKKSLLRYNITRIAVEEARKKREFSKEEVEKAEEAIKEKILKRFRDFPSDSMNLLLFNEILRIEAKEKLDSE